MTDHAKLSASGAARWMNCPGSVKAEEGLPETASAFANEGSAAHELAEKALKSNKPAASFIGTIFKDYPDWPITLEMAEFVQLYIDFVNALPGAKLIEERLDFSEWVPDGFGTADAIVIDEDILHIIDLKYGKGIMVSPEENPQAMLYALGAYALTRDIYDISVIDITIAQPRLDHIDTWRIDVDKLLKFGALASEAAEKALSKDAPRIAGEAQCRWCKAQATCPALKTLTDETVLAYFDDSPDKLSDSALEKAMSNKKLIVGWLDAVEELIKTRLVNGEGFPGYKLVAGRSTRKWKDEQEAINYLINTIGEENTYISKIISPAQAEKKVTKTIKQELQPLITSSSGAPTLVIESDKRPAINVTSSDFD